MNPLLETEWQRPPYAGGDPSDLEKLVRAYRYWRRATWPRGHFRPTSAVDALRMARDDVAAGTARYPSSAGKAGYGMSGKPFKAYGSGHMRWLESPDAAGLRFVGYADTINRFIQHTGWFLDDDCCGETVRGVVFQMAGRKGKPQFVAGYEDPFNGMADAGGPVCLDFSRIFEGEAGEWRTQVGYSKFPPFFHYETNPADHDGARDAARHADHIAERMAEKEREYRRASSAGLRYAELGEEIASHRRTALALIREIKAHGKAFSDVICSTLRSALREHIAEIRKAREAREELLTGSRTEYGYERDPVFREAAGLPALESRS